MRFTKGLTKAVLCHSSLSGTYLVLVLLRARDEAMVALNDQIKKYTSHLISSRTGNSLATTSLSDFAPARSPGFDLTREKVSLNFALSYSVP